MDCRDRNGCSGAIPDLFLVSYIMVEYRFREERSLAITHKSCTSVKNSRHRALSFWAVGWALISRTVAWSAFVEAAIAKQKKKGTWTKALGKMADDNVGNFEIRIPYKGKGVMERYSYTQWTATSLTPLSMTLDSCECLMPSFGSKFGSKPAVSGFPTLLTGSFPQPTCLQAIHLFRSARQFW